MEVDGWMQLVKFPDWKLRCNDATNSREVLAMTLQLNAHICPPHTFKNSHKVFFSVFKSLCQTQLDDGKPLSEVGLLRHTIFWTLLPPGGGLSVQLQHVLAHSEEGVIKNISL